MFAVFDIKTGAFKNFNEELYRVKHTIEDMAYNSKRIRDCCSIIQDHCIEPELEYEFSDHLNVMLKVNKERVYAEFACNYECDYPYLSFWTFQETIEPAVKKMITAFYESLEMKIDLDNIQNSDSEALSDFLAAVEYGDHEVNKIAESVSMMLAKK